MLLDPTKTDDPDARNQLFALNAGDFQHGQAHCTWVYTEVARDSMTSRSRGHRGRFVEGSTPTSRKVLVCLPEPFIEALDAYGRQNGTGRGRSIQKLLDGVLKAPPPPAPLPAAQKDLVHLELAKRSDPLYRDFRSRHYIPDRGIVGQSLQYLVFYGSAVVGVIGGSSAVYTNEARDEYWDFSEDKETKTRQLNSVINNNVFRLEYPAPNLATMVLSLWRKQIQKDWEQLYGVQVAGFETFVVEERLWNGKTRNGACYRADNWDLVGITKGYGDRNVRGREHQDKVLKTRKLIYCKRIPGRELCSDYTSSWNDPEKTKVLSHKRKEMFKDPLDLLLKSIQD